MLPWELPCARWHPPNKEARHMSHTLRSRSWLIGSIVGISLLGACAPEELAEIQTVGQELSAGTDLRDVKVSLSSEKASPSPRRRRR